MLIRLTYTEGYFKKDGEILINFLLFSHSVMSDCLHNPWTAAHQAALSDTISLSLLKLMSIESVMPSNHLILCRPLLLLSMFPSIRFFSSQLGLCMHLWNISHIIMAFSLLIFFEDFAF